MENESLRNHYEKQNLLEEAHKKIVEINDFLMAEQFMKKQCLDSWLGLIERVKELEKREARLEEALREVRELNCYRDREKEISQLIEKALQKSEGERDENTRTH